MVFNVLFTLLAATAPLVNAGSLYVYPPKSYAAGVNSLEDASAAISRHLGVDRFEQAHQDSKALLVEEDFVGAGVDNSLLLTMNEVDARVVLPAEFSTAGHVPMPKAVDSLASVASTYLSRASREFASTFEDWQLSETEPLLSFFETAEQPAFAALQVSKLQDLREAHGLESVEYEDFAANVRQFLEDAIRNQPNLNIAVLTYGSPRHDSRQASPFSRAQSPFPDRPLPQQPIGAISSCFATVESCQNATSSCSGHGNCVKASKAGRTCFVCACGATTTGEGKNRKTTEWAGQSCERKDISSSFVLLTGTVVVLIIIIVGSISLLYSVGDSPLPSILLATTVNSKKD